MRSDIQTDLNNAAQPATSRRKFLSSAGALGAASALPLIAGGAGMLLPRVASAATSNVEILFNAPYSVGKKRFQGVDCNVYRTITVKRAYESDDPTNLKKFLYHTVNCGDSYYSNGSLIASFDTGKCANLFSYKTWHHSSDNYNDTFLNFSPNGIISVINCNEISSTPAQRNGPLSLIPERASGFCTHAARLDGTAPLFSILSYNRDGSSVRKFRLVRLKKITSTDIDTGHLYEYSNELSLAQANTAQAAMDKLSSTINYFEKDFKTLSPAIKRQVGYLLGALSKNCTEAEIQITLMCFLFQETNGDQNYSTYTKCDNMFELASKAYNCRTEFNNLASSWTQANWSNSGTWCKNLT